MVKPMSIQGRHVVSSSVRSHRALIDARSLARVRVDRTRAGIHAYLRWLAAEPALARVFLIEIAAAGPEALERRERVRDRYAERMRELQTTNSVPDELFHAVVAAVDALVVRRLRAGDAVRELEPTILELQLALLRGQTLNN